MLNGGMEEEVGRKVREKINWEWRIAEKATQIIATNPSLERQMDAFANTAHYLAEIGAEYPRVAETLVAIRALELALKESEKIIKENGEKARRGEATDNRPYFTKEEREKCEEILNNLYFDLHLTMLVNEQERLGRLKSIYNGLPQKRRVIRRR